MIEHAIPLGTSFRSHTPTEYRRSVARFSALFMMFLVSVTLVGCRKPATTAVVPQGSSAKTPSPQTATPPPGDGVSGRNTILQLPFDNVAKLVLLNIGQAYMIAIATNNRPPRNAAELDAGVMKTKRDLQDHELEVIYGVNPAKLDNPGDYMIVWEKEPTNDGYRMVMMADFTTVKYVSQAEFEKLKRAK